MKTAIRNFFYYSRTETRGIVLLSLLIVLVNGIRLYRHYSQRGEIYIDPKELAAIKEWTNERAKEEATNSKRFSPTSKKGLTISARFNPNEIGQKEWMAMGFSEKESTSILRFKERCGGFKDVRQIQKIYCISEERFAQMAPFIDLPEMQFKHNPTHKEKSKAFIRLELNSADSLSFLSLRGIGPGWARRIMKRRAQLGGFYKKEQLLELKGFSDTLLQSIEPHIWIDTNSIQKMAINTITMEEIQKHPYCWYGVGKSIVNYRLQHGPYRSLSELKKIYTLKPEMYEKLVHYIRIE